MRLVVPGKVVLRSAPSQAGACWPQEVAWNLHGTILQPESGGGAAGCAVIWIKSQLLMYTSKIRFVPFKLLGL